MIRYEFQKLFAQKLTSVILAGLLVLNGLLVWHTATEPLSEISTATRMDISKVYESYDGQTAEEIAADLESWLETYQGLWYIDEEGNFHQPTQEQLDELLVFTDRIETDARLRTQILAQIQTLSGYEAYLDSVQENAERLSHSAFYSNENSFAYRNLIKTAEVYQLLYTVEVTPGDSSAVTMALEGHTTTVLLLFSMVLIVLNLTMAEREGGLLLLVKPTVNGRLGMITGKIWTLILSLLVMTLAFYSTNLAITGHFFGFGHLHRSIQSLEGYMTSPWMISVGQYIGMYLVAKYLGIMTVGAMFFLICIAVKNRIFACVIGAAIMMVELALYIGIPYHSWLSILRQMNLAALLNTTEFFSDYLCLNIFGFPVGIAGCSLSACVLVSGSSFFLSCQCWCREETAESIKSRKRTERGFGISTSLMRHEMYKLLVTCKGGGLLVFLILVQIISYSDMKAYGTEAEVWYQQYAEILRGDYSEEKARYLEEVKASFEAVGEQQQELYAQAERGEISYEYASFMASRIAINNSQEEGFYRAKHQYDYLNTQTEKGKTVQFVSTTGYDYLLDDTTSDVLDGAKLCFVLAVCFSVYFTMEDNSGMIQLILPSPAGKRKVIRYKLLASCGYLLLVWAAAFLPRLWGSLSIYPVIDGNYSAVSLPQFAVLPDGISILTALVLMNGSRLLGVVVVTMVIAMLSDRIKSPSPVFIISLIVLELPAFLFLLGVNGEALLLPLITGHWMMA